MRFKAQLTLLASFLSLTIGSILVANSSASARECKSVRLDSPGQPFSQIPAYDQRRFSKFDSGLCYAIAAAEIIDADRFFSGESIRALTSPISVGLYFKDVKFKDRKSRDDGRSSRFSNGENPLQAGDVQGALASADGHPVCDQRYLESYVSLIGQSGRGTIPNRVLTSPVVSSVDNFFLALDDQAIRFQQTGRGQAPDYGLNPYFLRRGNSVGLERLSSGLSRALLSENQVERAIESLGVICEDREHRVALGSRIKTLSRVPDFGSGFAVLGQGQFSEPSLQFVSGPQEFAEKAKSLLSSERPVPIAISVPFDDLIEGRDGTLADHAAVIIGKRPISGTNQCEFLVRNSYGPDCGTRKNESYPCEGGSVWVSEKKLFENMADMTWIIR